MILCGDLNINYLNDTSKKHLLDSLLASFSLYSTVKFPTRITNTSCTLIDNIYINTHKHAFTVLPLVNGLSDHDAQILTLSKFLIPMSRPVHSTTRKIDSTSINQFTLLLSYENWEDVFLDASVDLIFNNFLNSYICLFYASFPIKKSHNFHKSKPWLTRGIRISCANKRKLFLACRENNDSNFKEHYKKYCRTLSSVILLAKTLYYNKLLLKSNNKQKTTWNLVKNITNNSNTINNINNEDHK